MSDYTALAYLGFRGNFDALKASDSISIEPDTRLLEGHLDTERNIPKHSVLQYGSTHTTDEIPDLYTLIDKVIEKLKPHSDKLKIISSTCDCDTTLQIVLYFPMSEKISTPIIGLSPEAIQFVSNLNASIDIDTYRC